MMFNFFKFKKEPKLKLAFDKKEIHIQKIEVKPGEVLLVHFSEHYTVDHLRIIKELLEEAFPNNKILLCGDNVSFSIVSNNQEK